MNLFKKFVVLFLVLFISFSSSYGEETPKEILHFVQISDTHLDYTKSENTHRLRGASQQLLKTLVSQINNMKNLDFILATGDLINTPDETLANKFVQITKNFKYPFYIVLGNHDVGVRSKFNKEKYIKKYYKQIPPRNFTNKKPYYSFSPNEKFTFIILDGTTENTITSNGQIRPEQYNWLKNEIKKNKNKYVILASHFPVIEPFRSESHCIIEPDRTKLEKLINESPNVIAYFHGHYHAAKLKKKNNKIHNSCPALVQYPCAFREIIISESPGANTKEKILTFNFKWHVVDEPALVQKSKNASTAWMLTQGSPEDRENVISIKVIM